MSKDKPTELTRKMIPHLVWGSPQLNVKKGDTCYIQVGPNLEDYIPSIVIDRIQDGGEGVYTTIIIVSMYRNGVYRKPTERRRYPESIVLFYRPKFGKSK